MNDFLCCVELQYLLPYFTFKLSLLAHVYFDLHCIMKNLNTVNCLCSAENGFLYLYSNLLVICVTCTNARDLFIYYMMMTSLNSGNTRNLN